MNAAIMFTRVPVKGTTKTRLAATIGEQAAADFQRAMIADISDELSSIEDECDIFYFITPFHLKDDFISLVGGSQKYGLQDRVFDQTGNDLGERMNNAFAKVFSMGYEKVILFGSDIPLFSSSFVTDSLDALESCDVSISPTADGGYFMIGMRRLVTETFEIEGYGDESVMGRTLSSISRAKASFHVSPSAVRDLDNIEDLRTIYGELSSVEDLRHKKLYSAITNSGVHL